MSLQALFALLRRRWVILVVATVAAGTAGFGAASVITPEYVATVQVVTVITDSSAGSAGEDPVEFARNRITEYVSVLETVSFLERVRTVHGLGISARELGDEIRVSSPKGSSIMVLSARSTSPVSAADNVNATATEFAEVIQEREALLPVRATVLGRAIPPQQPFNPYTRRIAALSAWAGFVAALIGTVIGEAGGFTAMVAAVRRRFREEERG